MNRNASNTRWDSERDELLRQLWDQGWSAGKIATELDCGLSRCAVIGRARRLNLPRRNKPPSVKVVHPKPPKSERTAPFQLPERQVVQPLDNALPASQPVRSGAGISFMELTATTCRWPLTDEPPHVFCGAHKGRDGSYCAYHYERSITHAAPRQRNPRPHWNKRAA